MYRTRKSLIIALMGIGALYGCNTEEYAEPNSSAAYTESSYGLPTLCADGMDWASDSEVTAIENLVELAESNSVVTLPAGCFKMNNQLTIDSKSNLVLKGAGIAKTFLDFSDVDGKDGIAISGGSNITISDLQVSEASKNGIKADGVEGIIIRDVAAVWMEVPRARDENGNLRGTYGIYPVKSQNVLIEDTWSYGSADAGIYVGQTIGAVVRNNVAEKNIAGIEIENSSSVDVYGNLALGNTGGVLLFDLPGATTIGRLVDDVRIFDNDIRDNNLVNYVDTTCQNGLGGCGVVGIVPPGTGIVILSGRNGEFFNNTITNHDSMAVAMTSYLLVNGDPEAYSPLSGSSEGAAIANLWNPVPTNMYFHDNEIINVGANPNGALIEDMILAYNLKHLAFPAIFYDGAGESLIRSQMFAPIRDALNAQTSSQMWNYLTEFTEQDANCMIDNGGTSVGVLVDHTDPMAIVRYSEDPASADFLYEGPHQSLLRTGCDTKQPLAVNTVIIDGKTYGFGVDSPEDGESATPGIPNGIVGNDQCSATGGDINWAAITRESASYGENCVNLSQYRLFEDSTDPTQNLNIRASGKGTLYEMNVELFTDYARKYRFVVMPGDVAANYREQEVFDFPVGTVLIKTFVLPSNTTNAAGVDEEIIETRLLIHRSSGWVALPYVWNEDKTDATLTAVSVPFERSVVHKGETLNFTYEVPSRNECTLCHKVESEVTDPSGNNQPQGFSPIGPKARNMNSTRAVAAGSPINQLLHWENLGLIASLPNTPENLPAVPEFDTEAGASNLTDAELEDYAKAYLDVNCAHCHRTEGKAASNPFKFEYWRSGTSEMGICARGVTFHKGPSPFVIVPGDPDNSVLHYRINVDNGNMMPELGRHVVHQEGVALIADWISSIDTTGWTCVE
ncbi:SO2930 family diheme c-type cytochrome [Vibrio hangzhouensis]|uniref:SO2930 family diheme c-type cytochrome n=1 Tax=Vibrio hangzhouensis TaxID=462991 RepID=UPI001C96A846|nr:SO2930 family diheme c-type cytochrome [Vibrio hangzhouensis]MBY6198210.1 right-handed parallel beta-helix repeat-containing protein [Vibrio hangzhouensis]